MNIMLSCGEASGDLYAGALAAELHRRDLSARVFGFGGQRLAAAGGELIGSFDGLTVTGLTEALRVLPRSYAMLRRLVRAARARRPDVFVAIDFPDFNFRLAAALRRLGIPIVYYVSPQLWAWRPRRIETMKALVDEVLVIFPFERAMYERAGVPVEFVGHPLVDLARATESRASFLSGCGLDPGAPTVALLPGSRPNELHRIAPAMAAAIPLIRARVPDVQFVIACAPTLPDAAFAAFSSNGDARVPVLVRNRTDDVLAAADMVVAASGTATVQAALHQRPMVVVYRLSPLTYRLGKPFVSVQMYAMPNLVAGRRIVPELIQDGLTPAHVAEEVVSLLMDRERHAHMREELRGVCAALGQPGASARAAEAVLAVARGRRGAQSA
jgi:lipid-A-disaccharide synthase